MEGDGEDDKTENKEEDEEEGDKVKNEIDDEQQGEEEPVSIKDRLLDMFNKIEYSQTTLLGPRLCRSCPVEQSEANRDFTWDRELGVGTYGSVSLVFHDQGVIAMIRELIWGESRNTVACIQSSAPALRGVGHTNIQSKFQELITIHPRLRRL